MSKRFLLSPNFSDIQFSLLSRVIKAAHCHTLEAENNYMLIIVQSLFIDQTTK